jgi:hypothetical protein
VRHRPPLLFAAIAAALLCNYWVLEGLLADRYDLDSTWISDLATRSESSGWRFVTLGILAGVAIAVFAALLLRTLPDDRTAPDPASLRWRDGTICRPRVDKSSRRLRAGVLALLASGLFAILASAAPLDCAEGLEPTCSLAYDPLDVVHVIATGGEILTTVLAFGLIGIGLIGDTDRARVSPRITRSTAGSPKMKGLVTLALGAIWLLLTALTGVTYLSDGIDSIKGLLQRADQVIFGAWLILLSLWASVSERR